MSYDLEPVDSIHLAVALVNCDKGYRFSDWREPLEYWLRRDDGTPDTGAIYREARSEYGRCTGKVYVDSRSRGTIQVGWVFVSRQHYETYGNRDAGTYLREAWVTLVDVDDEKRELRSVQIGGAP